MLKNIFLFEKYLINEKRYSEHTSTAYISDIKHYNHFLNETNEEKNFSKSVSIKNWLAYLLTKENISKRSINRKISSLNKFFFFLIKISVATTNPIDKISKPKFEKQLPTFIKEKEINNYLDFYEKINKENNYQQLLEIIIIEVLYISGIRTAELINIKISDICTKSETLKVTGKRNKQRIIPLSNNTCKKLNNFLQIKDKHFEEKEILDEEYFFIRANGKKLYQKFVYRTVRKILDNFSTLQKKSPHVLRHTFATHLLNNGANLNSIKELLGHANLSATEVYTHNSFEQLKKIYSKTHPKA